jgi:aminomuconate-semialdehyde/2-hydroxymuconate-6-semialdehyde dehydrogenase
MSSPPLIRHLIGGSEVDSVDGRVLDNVNPWTREVHGSIVRGGTAEASGAIAAARTAFDDGPWPRAGERERAMVLNRLANLIDANGAALAAAEAADMGRPLQAAQTFDVPRASGTFRFFAEHLALSTADSYPMRGFHAFTAYRPAGVVVAISPWNYPLMLGVWKIAPALAWGNTVVWKPAEDSPTTAALVGRLALEAGMPPGVLNVIQGRGDEVGKALVECEGVDRITFTGSTGTGRAIAGAAAERLTPVTLELGGKGASLIFDDCDLDLAAATTARAVFNNSGQVCISGARTIVQESIREAFLERLVSAAEALAVGDPLDPRTDLGPLASENQYNRVNGYFDRIEADGGKLEYGGPLDGWCFAPTIITGLRPDSILNRDEIFGPLAMLASFDSDEEGLAMANDSRYGLSSVVFTESIARAHRSAAQLRTGTVWVNCHQVRDLRAPFGGGGDSGVGREGGNFSREFFTEPQAVFMATPPVE